MKFYCDACNTKYAISDDKVRGKVLKVRCKHCGNVITVREMNAQGAQPSEASVSNASRPQPPKPPVAPKTPEVPQNNWHYAVNGVTNGPFVLGALRAKYASGSIGDETYVWHDSFDSWKPVATVPYFQDALKQGAALKPRFQTMGYTGPLEAIEAKASLSTEKAGVVPERAKEKPVRTPEAKPRVLDALKEKPSKASKLDRLRQRLQEESEVEVDPAPSSLSEGSGGLGLEAPPNVKNVPRSTASEAVLDQDVDNDLSALVDAASSASSPSASEVDASDLIGQAIGGLVQESDSQPQTPMFPTSPDLGTERSQSNQVSGSLLIQLQDIKKTGRKKRFVLGGLIFVVLALLTAVAAGAYILSDPNEGEKTAEVKEKEREFQIKKYSKDEHNKFSKLELGEETLAAMTPELIAELEREDKEEIKETTKPTEKPKVEKAVKKVVKPNTTKKDPKTTDVKGTSKDDILAPRSTINRPKDKLVSGGDQVGLSREDAQRGFRKISRHVSLCRERHAARSGKPLGASKVKLTVDVKPTGKVGNYSLPRKLRNTAFDACLKSKKDTWRFASFSGPGVKINRTFVLQ